VTNLNNYTSMRMNYWGQHNIWLGLVADGLRAICGWLKLHPLVPAKRLAAGTSPRQI